LFPVIWGKIKKLSGILKYFLSFSSINLNALQLKQKNPLFFSGFFTNQQLCLKTLAPLINPY